MHRVPRGINCEMSMGYKEIIIHGQRFSEKFKEGGRVCKFKTKIKSNDQHHHKITDKNYAKD